MYAKHYHIFTHLLDAIQGQALTEKVNAPFWYLDSSKKKNNLTKTSIKLGKMPESFNSDDRNTLEFLVKPVYFGNVKDIENISLNEMRKHQFTRSTSNDLKKIAPSSDALNIHSLRAAQTAGFEWVECLHNVSVPNPSVRGYVLKDDMFVPSFYLKSLPSTLQNFFKHANVKQQSMWHVNVPRLVSHVCPSVYATESVF